MLWEIDPVHTSVEFSVRHMMVAKVKGSFSKLTGSIELNEDDPTLSSVEVEIDAASIDTNEPKRDAHLRSPDFFDVERFPILAFKSKDIRRSGNGYKVTGDLRIREHTREVVLDADFAGTAIDPWGNTRAGFSARTIVNRKDFGLNWNAALEAGGFLVGDKVEISIDVEAVAKAEAKAA